MRGITAYISGGSSGINLAIAQAFVARGASVLVFGRDLAKANAAAQGIDKLGPGRAVGGSADVRNPAAVAELFESAVSTLGKPNIVIAGAGGNFVAAAADLSANAFKAVVDIDLLGTFNVFRAGYKDLVKPGGVMLAVSAPQATVPTKKQAHVCAAKAGVNMLIKCLALEWGVEGIRVNGISPGPIQGTEGVERMASGSDAKTVWTAQLALKRFGSLTEVAEAVCFLVSPAASYITGTVLDFDGGSHLGVADSQWP
jgi:NAD(P)-dependent dehydrogenase (short-subunit alcohol dehydrogenase family)